MTYIYQQDTEFTIKPEHMTSMRDALLRETDIDEDANLREVFEVYDFEPDTGEGITGLEYIGEKQNDKLMDELFTILAPFVESGSYLSFYDDIGEHFRYVFAHGMVFRQYGEVVFPDVPNIPNFWSLPPALQTVILDQIKKGAPEEK